MFRSVALPEGLPGRLLLHSMPGRREPLAAAWREAAREEVSLIVRLTGLAEIGAKSPSYAAALIAGQVPFAILPLDIPDFGVPADCSGFLDAVRLVAQRIRDGEAVLVHCGAGIGRTGTFATAVLLGLGESIDAATRAVWAAGSGMETPAQNAFIDSCAPQLGAA